MEKNTPVKLTAKWWTDNKAKTLKDKGKLADALKKYEASTKGLVAKGELRAKALGECYNACKAMLVAANANAKACAKNVHDETCYVLKNTFKSAVEKRLKELKSSWETMRKSITKMSFDAAYKDRTYRVHLVQRAKKCGETNNLNLYLGIQNKKYQEAFDKYVKPFSGPDSANIKGALRKEFHKYAAENNLKKAPWPKLESWVRGQVYANLLGINFAVYVMGKMNID